MYQIESPSYFYLLFLLPLIVLVYIYVLWWKSKKQQQFASKKLLAQLSPEKSFFKSVLKIVVLCLGIALLIIALTNPKMGTKMETIKRQGVDIVFAFDVSRSMLAEDISPSRLEKGKQVITKIIDKLASDRIGIIIYAGNSYPLLPITTDHAAAKVFLQSASPDIVSSQGTAIRDAIERSISYFDNEEQSNRFLFIVSDGEDHEENATDLAEKALKEGIKIYTIGIGTPEGGPIPIKNRNNIVGYKKDQKGETVITKFNADILKEIAQKGKGKFIDGNNTNKTISFVDKLLRNAEKSKFESKQLADYKDQFQWFLGIGIFFLIIDVLLLEKKTKWIQKLNLFNQDSKK